MAPSAKSLDDPHTLTVGELDQIQKSLWNLENALQMQANIYGEGMPGSTKEQLRAQGEAIRILMSDFPKQQARNAYVDGLMNKTTAVWHNASATVWAVIGGVAVGLTLIVVNHFWPLPGGAALK